MSAIGWLGSLMLAVCCLPQAWQSYRTGHSTGISAWMIGLWGAGEVLTLAYVVPRWDWPLILNYGVNIVAIGVIGYYKWRPQ